MALRKEKVSFYSNNDPRYNFTIMDSNEYNKSIPPFGIREICKKRNRSHNPTLVADCASQRYEHCVSDPLENVDTRCDTEFYKFPIIKKKNFIPKKLNVNSFYSDIRISKLHNPNIRIDYSPDINNVDKSFTKIKKSYDQNMFEHFDIKMYKNSWLTFDELCTILPICCILCICIPCILACTQS